MPNDIKLFEITEAPLTLDDVAARVSRVDCGAIVTFAGMVRGETAHDQGTRETDFLMYEAYAEMAEQMLAQVAAEMQARWPKVAGVSILHRIGRIEVGEPSVVIAVATPHRGDGCFEACAYAIERLKSIVPIWKQENWADGQVWIEGPRQPSGQWRELDATLTRAMPASPAAWVVSSNPEPAAARYLCGFSVPASSPRRPTHERPRTW